MDLIIIINVEIEVFPKVNIKPEQIHFRAYLLYIFLVNNQLYGDYSYSLIKEDLTCINAKMALLYF